MLNCDLYLNISIIFIFRFNDKENLNREVDEMSLKLRIEIKKEESKGKRLYNNKLSGYCFIVYGDSRILVF